MISKTIPRLLQQQPERYSNRQQQQSSGSAEYQPQRPQQMGEEHDAAADYRRSIKSYLEKSEAKAETSAIGPIHSADKEASISTKKESHPQDVTPS